MSENEDSKFYMDGATYGVPGYRTRLAEEEFGDSPPPKTCSDMAERNPRGDPGVSSATT